MIASQTATAASTMPRSFRSRLLAALQKRQVLLPLESGPRATRALDGLRAVAALSVLSYHLLLRLHVKGTQLGTTTYNIWHYLATGVDLFFVLSGFLLFLPYARAMLTGKPLPSASRFYQRRALRILPAYWVCLVILAVLPTAAHRVPLSFGDIATHLLMIHDAFPDYNRDLNGPFWTLAVEAQFYLLLP
ncbi:MAG TPA: acyltransferase, partial [Ktedonobacterales bacterium]|nr:acyltransferase [Ktedonobacterales bacterium]